MKKKILSLIAAFTCLMLLAGCSESRAIKPSAEDIKAVGSVGDFDVAYEELSYVVRQYKSILEEKYGEGIWENAETAALHIGELTEEVRVALTYNYAILELCSEVLIKHDAPEIEKQVEQYMSEFIAEVGGRSAYIDQLEAEGLTDHFLRFCIAVDYCYYELFYAYTQDLNLIETDDDKILDYIMADNFVRTVHVYIQNDKDDDIEQNRKKAEDVARQLAEGADINLLIGSSVNEDTNLTTTDGYYFTRGEMVEPYENAAFALEIGACGGVVETSAGFYVIKRLPLEEKYVVKHFETLKDQYQFAEFNKIIDTRRERTVFTFNDYGNTLDLAKIN